jgi:hypothetical protein
MLLLAACGSSNAPSKSASHGDQFLEYSQCMRAHGVTDFPDPGNGGGIHLSSGINPFSPAFKAAQTECHKLLPGGGPGGNDKPSAQDKAQMLAVSQCMRAHGVTGFPDPTTTPPSSLQGASDAIGRDGLFIIVPSTIDTSSPAFIEAQKTCGFG